MESITSRPIAQPTQPQEPTRDCSICLEAKPREGLQGRIVALPCSEKHIGHLSCYIQMYSGDNDYAIKCPCCREKFDIVEPIVYAHLQSQEEADGTKKNHETHKLFARNIINNQPNVTKTMLQVAGPAATKRRNDYLAERNVVELEEVNLDDEARLIPLAENPPVAPPAPQESFGWKVLRCLVVCGEAIRIALGVILLVGACIAACSRNRN